MVSRLYDLLLLPPLHHDDMIPKPGLHFGVLGAIRRARLQLVRCLLKRRVQTPAGFPAERPAWEQSVNKDQSQDAVVVYIPCRALSSENSLATSSNLDPLRSFSTACSFFECFSHCNTLAR